MNVPLVGGPYDAKVFDIDVDRNGMPVLEELTLPRRTSIEEGILEGPSDAQMAPVKDSWTLLRFSNEMALGVPL